MVLDDVIKLLQTVGFPVTVAIFLLVRLDKTLAKMNAQLNQIVGILRVKDGSDKETE